jgi:hypothetical protein
LLSFFVLAYRLSWAYWIPLSERVNAYGTSFTSVGLNLNGVPTEAFPLRFPSAPSSPIDFL